MGYAIDVKAIRPHGTEISRLLRVLGNEQRLLIVACLAEGERSVSELEELLQLRQPALSQQLARLREEGLVKARRESRTVYYRVASDEALAIVAAVQRLYGKPLAR